MGDEWKQIGMQAAGGAVGTAMGMILGNHNDRRQRMQQDKLWQMEMKNRKEMSEFEMEQQYEMWLRTNYAAQKEQMKKAGLNPALLYGMGGGAGGQLGAAGGNVSGASAASTTNEGMAMMGMGMSAAQNAALNAAQIDLMKAQAEKLRGADTKKTEAETASLTQGITNAKTIDELNKVELKMKDVDAREQQMTQGDRVDSINKNLKILIENLRKIELDNEWTQATLEDRINIITAQKIQNELEIGAKAAGIKLTEEQIKAVSTGVAQKWKELQQGDAKIAIDLFRAELDATTPGIGEVLGRELNATIEAIWNATGQKRPKYELPKKK